MGGRRITREDIRQLKLKRKKKLRTLFAGIISGVLAAGAGIFCLWYMSALPARRPHGGEITVGAKAELGEIFRQNTELDNMLASFTDADASDVSNISANTVVTTEEMDMSGIEFSVPETSLADVEDIEGNNWVDESRYVKAGTEPVQLEYFNHAVFIGDSRTEGMLLYAGLPNLNGFCYKGLSVDKLESEADISLPGVEGKFSCYDAISMTNYDSYYCMFGVNELGWVYVDTFIEDFDALLSHIREVNPDAMIYVESILPVTEKASEENEIYKQERIDEFNERLLAMCMERKDVIYLDIAQAVAGEDGYLPEEASTDGIHCNAAYCKRLIQYIRCNTYTKK